MMRLPGGSESHSEVLQALSSCPSDRHYLFGLCWQFDSQVFFPFVVFIPYLVFPLIWFDHDTGAVAVAFAWLGISNDILPVPGGAVGIGVAGLIFKKVPHRETDGIGLFEENQKEHLVVRGFQIMGLWKND